MRHMYLESKQDHFSDPLTCLVYDVRCGGRVKRRDVSSGGCQSTLRVLLSILTPGQVSPSCASSSHTLLRYEKTF